jgi:hypothetical protein
MPPKPGSIPLTIPPAAAAVAVPAPAPRADVVTQQPPQPPVAAAAAMADTLDAANAAVVPAAVEGEGEGRKAVSFMDPVPETTAAADGAAGEAAAAAGVEAKPKKEKPALWGRALEVSNKTITGDPCVLISNMF